MSVKRKFLIDAWKATRYSAGMNLRQLLDVLDASGKKELAAKAGTVVIYLHQMADGHRRPSTEMAQTLVRCDSRLTLHELRPDVWTAQQAAA